MEVDGGQGGGDDEDDQDGKDHHPVDVFMCGAYPHFLHHFIGAFLDLLQLLLCELLLNVTNRLLVNGGTGLCHQFQCNGELRQFLCVVAVLLCG